MHIVRVLKSPTLLQEKSPLQLRAVLMLLLCLETPTTANLSLVF